MDAEPAYTIKVAAKMSGNSPHVIRIWERRYGAVTPSRSATARRLYTEADIKRLTLLRQATEAGHSIGRVARLATPELATLVEKSIPATREADGGGNASRAPEIEGFINECWNAVQALDATALRAALEGTLVGIGRIATMQQVLSPLMDRIGEHWHHGDARIAQEHMAATTVRQFLGNLSSSSHGTAAPLLVVATPTGQIHELGALMVAATADSAGWRVLYLGPDLPAEEIAAAARRTSARAIALSIVYPADDPRLRQQLQLLRRQVPETITVVAGGRNSKSLLPTLSLLDIVHLPDLPAFHAFLDSQRQPAGTP